MKGLMVALLTLLIANSAAAQQQQEDDGGSFVLELNKDQFDSLIKNPAGLVAPIPPAARGVISKVEVRLAKDVQENESAKIVAGRAGFPTSSAEIPALPQDTTRMGRTPSTTPNGFRNPNRVVENSQSDIKIPYAPPNRFEPTAPAVTQPWIASGDDSDFAPVVRKNQFLQPRQRANHLADRGFNNGLGEFQTNPNVNQRRDNTQFVGSPNLDRNTQFRNRDLDLASRNIGDFNPGTGINPNNGREAVQPNDQTIQMMRQFQDSLKDSQDLITTQNQKMNAQDREIEDLKYQLQRSQAMYASTTNNFAENPGDFGNESFSTRRSGSGERTPITNPQINNVQNTTGSEQVSPQDASQIVKTNQPEVLADTDTLKRSNMFLLFMLLFSIGLNIYLGLIARSFYTRYAELADELRETFTATM